ncbi:UDP-glucuronosyltransferase 3A1-like [Lethenteron reissneri]|uniref:UDP-glucuronosyltransferase 3A1-like n=1 Tax=Lethenteron reissneri TaxID=7753 RepID=UPI002AB6B334|nr:UDP-glucuronosyltransferase 3A1-like [Lethenteron reissneri]
MEQFDAVIRKHLGGTSGLAPTLWELSTQPEMWFFNVDFALESARPLPPYAVCVGGLLARPPRPLPPTLDSLLSGPCSRGFVLVSLGSMVSSVSDERLLGEMSAALSRLAPLCVLWRHADLAWPRGRNVHVADWLPHNDLMGHSGARLLVSHGGMNSVYEAIYHGVPAVMIPLFGDQHRNCRLAQSRGFAVCLRVASLDRDALHSALHGALQEPRLRAAARAASALHRSLPMSPGATLSRWLEHVTAVGGAEHLRPRAATAAAAGLAGIAMLQDGTHGFLHMM